MGLRNYLDTKVAPHFEKGGKSITRTLNPDRLYRDVNGGELQLHGRSLLLRNSPG